MLHHPKGWGMLLAIQCQRAAPRRSKTRNMGATGRLSDALQGMSSARLETDAMQMCNHFWLSHSAGDIDTKTAVHAPSSHDWGGQSCVVGALQRKKTQSGLYRRQNHKLWKTHAAGLVGQVCLMSSFLSSASGGSG